jgi:hypothetical protein
VKIAEKHKEIVLPPASKPVKVNLVEVVALDHDSFGLVKNDSEVKNAVSSWLKKIQVEKKSLLDGVPITIIGQM